MRRNWIQTFICIVIVGVGSSTSGQEGASDHLIIRAKTATTWVQPGTTHTNIVQLEGPLSIDLDRTRMVADHAVLWLTPVKGTLLEEEEAAIALLGNVRVDQQGQVQQEGERLYVTATVRGLVRMTVDQRRVGSQENGEVYQAAQGMRPPPPSATPDELDNWLTQPSRTPATTQAATPARKSQPVAFSADKIESVMTEEGTVAIVVTGNVKLFQRRSGEEMLEMQADRAVLFTPLRSLKDLEKSDKFEKVEDAVSSAYLEGDVRIVHTPPGRRAADQRLLANRTFYDFETDRAILTDAVIHTVEPQRGIPLTVRARTVRQLSMGEYRGEKVKLTQSSFFTPSYHIGMKQAYIRQVDTGDSRYGSVTQFSGKSVTFDLFGNSVFYLPAVAGQATQRGGALRDIELGGGTNFGYGFRTDWGLFELLGQMPPKGLDSTLSLDYFAERGPAVGLDGKYEGGFVTDLSRQPWAFEGRWETYLANDHGEDDLGRKRLDVEPSQSLRYRLFWEHQFFFPDNWQVQLSGALISDATFQEEWFMRDFYTQRPLDTAIYIKRQEQSEAFTLLASFQPNDFVTTSNLQQEQAEIERVPELSYHRIGDSIGEDGLTFFSNNTLGGLRFQNSSSPLFVPAGEEGGQGFRGGDSPGLPSFGQTGKPTRLTYRGDFRQEVDYPFSLGRFRFVPYVMGRYTWYSQSPDPEESSNDRIMAGAGLRVTTSFWKVDDTAKSDLWDIHRLRHVIEPELNVFTSASTTDREHLYLYDEAIDSVTDISALQLALRQRWQTKRGGPGRWRSVDFFTLNVEANFFMNQPSDAELNPVAFRGLYFSSLPEASIPRNSINSDAVWRVSDTTAVLSDVQFNLDEVNLSTASLGLAVSRDERMAYFAGVRYIDSGGFNRVDADGTVREHDLHSVVVTGAVNYQLTTKYTMALAQSFDFGERERVQSRYSLIRHFDRWYASVTFRVDHLGDDSGVFVNVWPEGLGAAAGGSERLLEVFR